NIIKRNYYSTTYERRRLSPEEKLIHITGTSANMPVWLSASFSATRPLHFPFCYFHFPSLLFVFLDLNMRNAVLRRYCCGGWAVSLSLVLVTTSGYTLAS
ncbi:MAG: hypothetical protein AAFY41_09610, partial [Bacteroidota bacterium]